MPEVLSNYVTFVDYMGSPWAAQGYESLGESSTSVTTYPPLDCRIYRQRGFSDDRSEVAEVDVTVPSAEVREYAKTLEGDLPTLREQQTRAQSDVVTLFEELQTRNADISVRRVLLPAVRSRGVLRVRELMSPASALTEWLAGCLAFYAFEDEVIDIQSEGNLLLKYASAEVLEQITEWGIQDQVDKGLEVIAATYRSLGDVQLSISEDPEIPDRKRLRLTLNVSGTLEEVFEDELCFKNWMLKELDPMTGELIAITYKWE